MSAADIWNVGICLTYLLVQAALIIRVPHYLRTGRWFRR